CTRIPSAACRGGGAIGAEKLTGQVKYTQDQWLGRWPAALSEARRTATHQVVRDSDILWRMEGDKSQVLVGIMASTDQITFGKIILLPGQESEVRVHGGDNGIYVEEGEVHVRLPQATLDERGQTRWLDAKQTDGVFLPADTPYQLYNPSKRTTTLIFGVAPDYLPRGPK
ncbi:cupin domain-containing protein, partial [Acidobacteria bacterium AH-259-G07]|nr:cupin domain-containing protein [Acidobacteria bacterium AH-259-G07]